MALHVAERGVLYISANSPNDWPGPKVASWVHQAKGGPTKCLVSFLTFDEALACRL